MEIHIRIDEENDRHTKITVFIDGANCGKLCLASPDWPLLKAIFSKGTSYVPIASLQISKLKPLKTE